LTTPAEPLLRVSAAALCQVIFPHPQTQDLLLALERRDIHTNQTVRIQAQPFGGALRILDPAGFRAAVGDFAYDSLRSSEEQDLRILIRPNFWDTVRDLILAQMRSSQPELIETDPCRELEEEFRESVGIALLPAQYTFRPIGISVQNRPTPTTNSRSPGALTVRIYRIFEVALRDSNVRQAVVENSQRFTDEELQVLAQVDSARGGPGRVNGVLVLPFEEARAACRKYSEMGADSLFSVQGHALDATTAVLFE
jgi:hypothetical protein